MRDFLPRAAARRLSLASRLGRVFEAWGYARIITPVFECADVLDRALGGGLRGDAPATAIRFVEPLTGEVVALRADITPQVARLVATRLADHESPVRLCYEGAVYRVSGRLADDLGQREILQAGVELIDLAPPAGDAEALAVASAALAAAGLPTTRLDLGHVAPVRLVLGAAASDATRAELATALAKKDRLRLGQVARALPADVAPLAEALGGLWGPAEPTLERAFALAWPDDVRAGLEQLRAVLQAFGELVDPESTPTVTIDLGDVRGFDYYTGVRFAGYADGAPDAVLRGGRYDTLIGRYGRAARATGFAIDVEGLAQAQAQHPAHATATAAGVALHGPGAAAIARGLRERSLRVVTCPEPPTASWLAAAGLDAAVLIDGARGEIVRPDGSRAPVAADAAAIATLLEAPECPS